MNWIPLKYVVELNPEILPDTTPPEYEFDYVDIGSVDRHRGIMHTQRLQFSDAPSRARRVVRTGDVLISTVRTYLRAVVPITSALDGQVCSTGFAVLRPTPRIDPKYLLYVVSNSQFVDEVVARSTGISYPAINPSDLVRIAIPLPNRGIQEQISCFLDRECTNALRLDEQLCNAQDTLHAYRDALITEAITGQLSVPVAPGGEGEKPEVLT